MTQRSNPSAALVNLKERAGEDKERERKKVSKKERERERESVSVCVWCRSMIDPNKQEMNSYRDRRQKEKEETRDEEEGEKERRGMTVVARWPYALPSDIVSTGHRKVFSAALQLGLGQHVWSERRRWRVLMPAEHRAPARHGLDSVPRVNDHVPVCDAHEHVS